MTELRVFIVKACLKSQKSGDLCSSGMLRSQDWQTVTDVSRHPFVPILKSQVRSNKKPIWCTETSVTTNLFCVTYQKSEDVTPWRNPDITERVVIVWIWRIKYKSVGFFEGSYIYRRSLWPRGLRRDSAAARLMGLGVRILPGAWISVSCECCVF